VWVVTALHGALLLVGSLLQPMFAVPDERYHADMIMAVAQESGWPDMRERRIGSEIELASRLLSTDPKVASNAIPRAFPEGEGDEEVCGGLPIPTCRYRPELNYFSSWDVLGNYNRMAQHPPLYYVAVSTVAHGMQMLVPPAFDLSFDQELLLYRLVTLLMVVPLPLLTLVLSRELTDDEAVQYGATALTVFVVGLHIRNGAMINNDNLLLLLGASFLVFLIRIAKGDTSTRTALVAGLILGLSLLTKAFAIVLIPTLAVGYGLQYLVKRSDDPRPTLKSGLLALGVTSVIGGWWWLWNVLRLGTLLPKGAGIGRPAGPEFEPSLTEWFRTAAESNIETFIGGDALSNLDHKPLLFWTLVVFIAAGLTLALLLAQKKKQYLWLILLPTALVAGGIMINGYRSYSKTARVAGVNGRYLYTFLSGIYVIMACGYVAALNRIRRFKSRVGLAQFVPLTFLVAAAALQIHAALRKLHLEWGSPGTSLSDKWDALLAWSALPERWLPALFALPVVLFVAALVIATKFALQPRDAASVDSL
jgi:hypothetical protein